MAKPVSNLLEAFYNVLYKMLFEAVALFTGRDRGWRKRGGDRSERESEE